MKCDGKLTVIEYRTRTQIGKRSLGRQSRVVCGKGLGVPA